MFGTPKTRVKVNLGVYLIVRTFCVLFVIKLWIDVKWHRVLLMGLLYAVDYLPFSTAPSTRLYFGRIVSHAKEGSPKNVREEFH